MSQIETQLRTIDYLSRLQYQKHLKNLSVLTDSKDEKERYKKVIQLIDNLNAVNFEFSN
jgi:hypothetical protein